MLKDSILICEFSNQLSNHKSDVKSPQIINDFKSRTDFVKVSHSSGKASCYISLTPTPRAFLCVSLAITLLPCLLYCSVPFDKTCFS